MWECFTKEAFESNASGTIMRNEVRCVGITAAVVVLVGQLLGDLLGGLLGQPHRQGYSAITGLCAEEPYEYSYKYRTNSLTVGHQKASIINSMNPILLRNDITNKLEYKQHTSFRERECY